MRQQVVTFERLAEGAVTRSLDFKIVGPNAASGRPSDDMLNSIERFFGLAPSLITAYNQASSLLSLRDFAKAAAEVISPSAYGSEAQKLAKTIAAYLSQDAIKIAGIEKIMRDRFDSDGEEDELTEVIENLEVAEELRSFVRDVNLDLQDLLAATSLSD